MLRSTRRHIVCGTMVATLALAFGAAAPAPAAVEEVVVVFKTHFDLGYTDSAKNVVEKYRTTMIDKALDVCDATKDLPPEHRFVWTVSGWPMTQILWPGQTPERRARIEAAIRDGRLVWHALPGSSHTESLDLESFTRGMIFSSRLSREFGQPLPRDAKMTDVPSHTWIVPTILKRAGVDFLHLGCNSGSASPDLPRLFWWEGPDGSRLLTMYDAAGYGSGLKPPADWPYKTWLAMMHTGDNEGPPAPDKVEKLLDQAAKELPGVKIRMGRLSDFGDVILKEKPDLPVVRADMPDTWIFGIMAMPVETKIAQNVRPDIATLDTLNTLLGCWGVKAPPARRTVASAYEKSWLYGEHTWGDSLTHFDGKPPADPTTWIEKAEPGWHYGKEWEELRKNHHYDKAEATWKEHGDYARGAQKLAEPALTANLEALAGAVNIDGPRVVVFNPLPWVRDDFVSLPVLIAYDVFSVEPGGTIGERLPAIFENNTLRFFARQIPPLGYRTYRLELVPRENPAAAPVGEVLESELFRVTIDRRRGGVSSLIDKRSGRELVDAKSPYAMGQYLYERFDAAQNAAYLNAYRKHKEPWTVELAKPALPSAKDVPYSAASPKDFKLTLKPGGEGPHPAMQATLTAAASSALPHKVTLKVTLYAGLPCVDFEWSIKDKPVEPWPEAGWLCFPLQAPQPAFRLARLGSIVDPAKDLCRGANHEVFCLSGGMTVAGADGQGEGLCPLDSPLVSLGRPGLLRYTRDFEPRAPVVFVNLFNNVWGTNFQQWFGGSWSSRVRLWAADGKGAEQDLVTPSLEARCPCKAALFDGQEGTLPPVMSGIELLRKGALLTSLGPNPDGKGILLRLWEQAGQDGTCRVRLPEGIKAATAQPCDLRGQPQGAATPIRGGGVEIPLTHFAPTSVLLMEK